MELGLKKFFWILVWIQQPGILVWALEFYDQSSSFFLFWDLDFALRFS